MSLRKMYFSSAPSLGQLDETGARERRAHVFRLPARVAAGDVRIAIEPRHRVAEEGLGEVGVAVGGLAGGEVLLEALLALAAGHLERHHHAIAHGEAFGLGLRADFHHLAHGFVTHDVAQAHGRHQAVEQVQVRAADAGGGDLDDGVARILDLRIRHALAAQVFLALASRSPSWRVPPKAQRQGRLRRTVLIRAARDQVESGDRQDGAKRHARRAAAGVRRS